MLANKDNAVYIEKITEQDSGDTDWVAEKNTTVSYIPKEIPLESDTTSTSLATLVKVTKDDEVKLIEGSNIVEGELGNITINNTTNTLDILGNNSCVACYPLNGNANDLSGNYNGTWSGTALYDTGKFGQAAKFDGSNYINISNLWSSVPAKFSFSMWFYASSNNVGINEIKNSNETNYHLELSINNSGVLSFLYYDGASVNTTIQNVNLNSWYNVVVVSDMSNKTLTFYINGKHIKTETYSGTLNTAETDFVIGKMHNNNFKGLIDQVRISNKALTADEVAILYKEGIKYIADITNLNLSNAPTKAFFNNDITTSVCVEANKDRIIDEPLIPIIIDSSTAKDGSNIITPTKIYANEEIVINDITAKAGTITFNSNTNLYTILLSNHNLTSKPCKAYKKGRISLSKVSSTTTQFVGTYNKSGLLQIGDKVLLDSKNEISVKNISESGTASPYTYTIAFDTQSVAPSTCEILSRDTVLQKITETYDNTDNVFKVTYNDLQKQGRAINRKIQAQKKDTEVVKPLQTELWKDS